jgi:hypothetical protein
LIRALAGLVVDVGSSRVIAFRKRRSDVRATAQGSLVLRLRFPGVRASLGLLLRNSLIPLPFHADDDEKQQNGDANDAEDGAH